MAHLRSHSDLSSHQSWAPFPWGPRCWCVGVEDKPNALAFCLPCRGLALAAFLGLILWLALDTSKRPEQLVSFAGMCVFIGILFACSKHHCAVSAGL